MTVQELIDILKSGAVIECSNVFQRKNVLEFFDNLDFVIGPNTRTLMNIDEERGRDTDYMHPGLNTDRKCIACYASTRGKTSVNYKDIADIVENPYIPKIDERSDAEFAEDFALLMC